MSRVISRARHAGILLLAAKSQPPPPPPAWPVQALASLRRLAVMPEPRVLARHPERQGSNSSGGGLVGQPPYCTAAARPDLVDGEGNIVPPPRGIDYFAVFGLERTFDVDTGDLASTYKSLQRLLHPDKFTLKSDKEKELSDQWSALVNEVGKILILE